MKIEELSRGAVEFYSAILGENELSEFELFLEKDFSKHEEEIQITVSVIHKMSERGALSHYFKDERLAHAIPIVPAKVIDENADDYGVRLYCIRINDWTVVLLNGGIKTHQNPINCVNVKRHFQRANAIAKEIDKAIINRDININETDFLVDFECEI